MRPLFRSPLVILALLTILLTFRLTLAVTVIPPWQNPDEPQHMALVRESAQTGKFLLPAERDPAVEVEILESLVRFGWWEPYDEIPPPDFSHGFRTVEEHILGIAVAPPFYYAASGTILRVLGVEDLMPQYTLLRGVSVVLAILTLWCIWGAALHFFGLEVAIGSATLVALHPQFAIRSVTVTPDALVVLLGAVIWWQCARLLTGRAGISGLTVLLLSACVMLLTKRMGAPVVAAAALVAATWVWLQIRTRRPQNFPRSVVLVIAVVAVLLLVARRIPGADPMEHVAYLFRHSIGTNEVNLQFFGRFVGSLIDSAWLYAGWLRFPAPTWWFAIVRGVLLVSLAGVVLAAWRSDRHQRRAGMLWAAIFVGIQAAVIVKFFLNGTGAPGRYFFPAFGPFLALFWLGLRAWWPERLWPFVASSLVMLMAVLDALGWALVVIPAYL